MSFFSRAIQSSLLVAVAGCLSQLLFATAQAQPVDLGALGISADFEIPDADPDDSNDDESFTGEDIGTGWTVTVPAGQNFGVQDPPTDFFGAQGPLPAPFEGRQFGFMNLGGAQGGVGTMVSDVVGAIAAGEVYTLNVAVGTRFNQDPWNVQYDVGLQTLFGTSLGTFATTSIAGADDTITDLEYILDVDNDAADFVGEEVQIVIRNTNLNSGFSQGNFDNVRLDGAFAEADQGSLVIDRQTGSVTLSKTGPDDFAVRGYSLTSDSGSFDHDAWTTVSEAYDESGDGSVDDNDNWSVLSAAGDATDLSEFNFDTAVGDPGAWSTAEPIELGTPWLPTPFEDVEAEVKVASGAGTQSLFLPVEYTGSPIPVGDLNGSGDIDAADWSLFKEGPGTDFTGLSAAEAYLHGDLDGDLDHDLADFSAFRTAFDEANGAGSFLAMVTAVPEPRSWLLLILACLAGLAMRLRPVLRPVRVLAAIGAVALLVAGGDKPAHAQIQDVVAHWSFDADNIVLDGGNVVTLFEDTGNHDASVGAGTFTSSDVVPGQFGESIRFNGDNHLTYPNLTELMESAGAPSYTISMWVQWPSTTAAPGGGTPFATMSNWGDVEPGTPGETSSHVYAFGPNGAMAMRGQSRAATDADGGDIFAQTSDTSLAAGQNGSSGTVNDGDWHMYTWTFDSTTGDYNAYFDAFLVENSSEGGDAMADSTSPTGNFGWKADSMDHLTEDVRLDEVWVATGVATQDDVNSLFTENFGELERELLTLRIDPSSGRAQLRNDADGNDTGNPITFSSYRITSDAGSLDASGWLPIADQAVTGFPSGDGTGNGWEAAPGSNSGVLVEWFLEGESTLDFGDAINLGFAFDENVNDQNVRAQFTLDGGAVRQAEVVYGPIEVVEVDGDYNGDGTVDLADYTVWRDALGSSTVLPGDTTPGTVNSADYQVWKENFGNTAAATSLAAGAVPEPSSAWLLAAAPLALWWRRSRRGARPDAGTLPSTRLAGMALVALLAVAVHAHAAVTVDRLYRFGDEDVGPAFNAEVDVTFDSIGSEGTNTFADLGSGGTNPTYVNVGSNGLGRPGAGVDEFGIAFDGDDYLFGDRFNHPATAPGTIGHQGGLTGPNDYSGILDRGFQVWVYPDEANLEDLETDGHEQFIVHDTTEHGARIDDDRSWHMIYDGGIHDSNVPADPGDQWYHVMVVTLPGASGSVLYVDGEALQVEPGGYDTTPDDEIDGFVLTVGTRTNNDVLPAADSDFFTGVMDELEFFAYGTTTAGNDLGTFDFAADNDWAAMNLTGVAGDVSQDGVLNDQDVNALIAGWGSENRVNGFLVGDKTTIENGDLDFNGEVNLDDAVLLHDALLSQGLAGLDFSRLQGTAVPEPSACVLAVALAAAGIVYVRRRRSRC